VQAASLYACATQQPWDNAYAPGGAALVIRALAMQS
jgi:hypothetical protein